VAKSDIVESPEKHFSSETSPAAITTTTTTTHENNDESPQIGERDDLFKSSFAKRVSLTPQSQSGSKSSPDVDGSPQKEVIQYTVSIKLRGNSLPRHEASPEEKTTKFVDIKLTDCSSQESDNSEEIKSVPIPVFHYPEPETENDQFSSNNNNDNSNGNNNYNTNQSRERPNSIFLGPQTNSQNDGPTSPWRSIPIAKVDKSPSFEVPTFNFPHQQQQHQQQQQPPIFDHSLQIEEINHSDGSSPSSDLQHFTHHHEEPEDEQRENGKIPKCKSFVEFEELSDEASLNDDDDDNDENVDDEKSEVDSSESDQDQVSVLTDDFITTISKS
jgi:hypothetical protein